MKLLNNLVLVKPIVEGSRTYKDTHIILGVTAAAKDQYLKNYAKRNFEVVAVPDRLTFPKTRLEFFESGYAFRYRTEMELKVGDIVWVKLRSGHGATQIGDNYAVHYADIFVAQRRNLHRDLAKPVKNRIMKDEAFFDIIPLNGNVICDKVLQEKKLVIRQKTEIPGRLKVKYVGKPSKSYFTIIEDRFVEMPLPQFEVKSGDIIQADGPYLNVEGEYFHDFNGESQPVTIHHSNIAIVL